MVRLLWFDRQLRALKFPTARAYAEAFEITERTAYRDVESFKDQMQLPIGYDPKRRGHYYTEPNAPLSPMVAVSAGELVAVYIAQRVLEQYQGTQFGARLAHASVSRAVTERKGLAIEYLTQSRGEVTRRVVDPYHLHHHGGAWYLIGYCHRTRAVRTFNVSQIRKATRQPRSFEREAGIETGRPGGSPRRRRRVASDLRVGRGLKLPPAPPTTGQGGPGWPRG